jgi:hypothetical protein
MTDQDPFFIASFLEACILFDPGGDVATLPICDIENVGVQTADNHLLVSRDSETTTDEEILHICPSLIHFVMTLEQQFITIDDLLTEEALDLFTDNATDPFDGSASSVSKEQLCIPLGAHDTRNSMPFAPLWIIFSVMCAPPCDFSESWGDFHRLNDGYSIDPLVLEPQHGSTCISAKVDIQVLMCLLARLLIGLSICNGSSIVACDDHPLLAMHHLGHQSFPSMKYKQIQHNGTTSSFEPSTDYDTVNVIDLEWICQDPFCIKIKQVQCDGVAFSLFNIFRCMRTSQDQSDVDENKFPNHIDCCCKQRRTQIQGRYCSIHLVRCTCTYWNWNSGEITSCKLCICCSWIQCVIINEGNVDLGSQGEWNISTRHYYSFVCRHFVVR